MKLTIVLNSNDPETAWNVFRLGHKAVAAKDLVTVFLLGSGVELETIQSDQYPIQEVFRQYLIAGGEVLACGTCLKSRHSQGSESCPASNLETLYQLIKDADKVLTF
jgi:uncharacterized protein involved in oxidation of intracellular sulfur